MKPNQNIRRTHKGLHSDHPNASLSSLLCVLSIAQKHFMQQLTGSSCAC